MKKVQYWIFETSESLKVYMYLTFDLPVYKMSHVILATLQQFSFHHLLKFIIISSVHGAFSLSTNEHAQALELKISANKVLRTL